MAVATGGPPPAREGRRVLIIKVGELWHVRFLAPWLGCYVHFVRSILPRGRSKPHHREGCPWCAECGDPEWKAYAPVRACKSEKTVVDGATKLWGETEEWVLELCAANIDTLE